MVGPRGLSASSGCLWPLGSLGLTLAGGVNLPSVLTRSRLPRPLAVWLPARPSAYSFWSPLPSRELLTISFCLRTFHMPTSAFWVVFQLVSLQLHLSRVPVTACSALGSPGQALRSLCPAPPERLLGPSCVCHVSLQVLRPGFPGTVPSAPGQKESLQNGLVRAFAQHFLC